MKSRLIIAALITASLFVPGLSPISWAQCNGPFCTLPGAGSNPAGAEAPAPPAPSGGASQSTNNTGGSNSPWNLIKEEAAKGGPANGAGTGSGGSERGTGCGGLSCGSGNAAGGTGTCSGAGCSS